MAKQQEEFEENISKFQKFLDTVRGVKDWKSRLNFLLNPDKIETSTNLSQSQVQFVTISLYSEKCFKFFKPLADYAHLFCLVNMSKEGWGVESSIRLNSAISESKFMEKIGLTVPEKQKVK